MVISMGEDLWSLMANWAVLTYFGGHSITNDGNIIGFGIHCSNNILGSIPDWRLDSSNTEQETAIMIITSMPSIGVSLESGEILDDESFPLHVA